MTQEVHRAHAESPLSFVTIFDQPVPLLPVPTVLTAGQRPELQVVDRFTRGVAIVGRFALSPSLIGAKVDVDPTRPLRVRVRLSIDKMSEEWWHKRPPEHVTREDTATGRLLVLRSQGETRAVCYLAPANDTHGAPATGTVEFDLPAGSVTKEGLLILEAVDAPTLPDWAESRIMSYGQVGVRIDQLDLLVSGGGAAPVTPFVGRQRDGFAAQLVTTWPQPDGSIAPVHVRVRRQHYRAAGLARRAVNKAIRESRRRLHSNEPTVEMHDVLRRWLDAGLVNVEGAGLETGSPVPGRLVARSGSNDAAHAHADLHIEQDAVREPVLLRIVTDATGVNVPAELGTMQLIWDTPVGRPSCPG
ncbi:hypothetical protein [Flexivirga alba]|uniref:Uncharacterized protein n=1 Tax=Flexivirga alba TaxID=702742 RepID=A0ABW2AM45_9MICO